jgi:hypothetical protein
MVSIAGGAATEDSADPELIVSFGDQYGDLRDSACVVYGQAPSFEQATHPTAFSKVRFSRSPSLRIRDTASNRVLSSGLFSLSPDGNKRAVTPQKFINIGSRHGRVVGVTDPTVGCCGKFLFGSRRHS